MSDNELDKLLKVHFAQAKPESDFHELRSAVWAGIEVRENKRAWLRAWAMSLLPPQTHFAPAAFALIIGIAFGMFSTGKFDASQEAQLGFDVFSSAYSHPLKG